MAEYKQLTLSKCAEFDHQTGQKNILTGWGIVSKERREKKISRKQIRLKKQAQANN